MQMKYLSLALAAALATTLTACGGSDNKSNYNKDTLTPVTNPDAGNTGGTTDGGNTGGTTDGGNTNTNTDGTNDQTEEGGDGNGDGDGDGKGETKPTTNDLENNPGDAANAGNLTKDNITVLQNYIRGQGAANAGFDITNNPTPADTGNATVIGFNEQNNPYLTNIVLARVPLGNDKYTVIYTGQTPEEAGQVGYDAYGSLVRSDLLDDDGAGLNSFHALQVLNDTIHLGNSDTSEVVKTLVDFENNGTNLFTGSASKNSDAYATGIVAIKDLGGYDQYSPSDKFDISGQEDLILNPTALAEGKVEVLHSTGGDRARDIRMFGTLYNDQDAPSEKFDGAKFVINQGSLAGKTYNSFYLTSDIADATIKSNTANVGKVSNQISPNSQHLDYVQYGRVTANADKTTLTALDAAHKQRARYFHFDTVNHREFKDGQPLAPQNADDTSIDYYFSRGLQPTTEMPKSGKVTYLGHALMYGLDNSFHGGVDGNKSNTLRTVPQVGTGNYVAAELDTADKTVKGKIYNVWTRNSSAIQTGTVEDILVNFSGKLNDTTNSVIGDAYRPYIAKDTKAAFKGAFFGPAAEEFGGSINSINKGFGEAKWGGVFGAKRTATPTTIDFENAVEKPQD